MTDRLHGRRAHLLALATPRRRFCLGLLTVVLPEARIHVMLNCGSILKDVGHHALLDRPPEEVELTNSGLLDLGLSVDLERNALTTTERIKQPLAIRLEFALILEMDNELFVIEEVGHIELFGIVGDEPLDDTETNRRGARQKWQNLINAPRIIVELL